jgi:phage protein D
LELGEGLRDLSVRMSAARQAESFAARGWDFRKKEPILGESPAVVLWHENGQKKSGGEVSGSVFPKSQLEIVNHVPRSVDEAKQLAAAAATDQEGQFFEASGTAWGNPKLVAGVEVELKGLGDTYSGKYFVTRAVHVYGGADGYAVHFAVSGRYPQSFNQLLRSTQGGSNQRGLDGRCCDWGRYQCK